MTKKLSKTQPRASMATKDTEERHLWTPTLETAVSLLLVPRVISSLLNPIADCDETFNYWEPLHYLMYGFGFQTWEYSPLYALRSYLYLLVHLVVVKLASWGFSFSLVGTTGVVSKVMLFYGLRGALALVCSYCEALFYRACIPHFGRRTARYLLWILLFNAGMFHASTAFLPSTFVMYLIMLFLTAWMERQHFLAIFWGVVAVLCGWPYVGVLFVPFMFDTLHARGVVLSLIAGASIGLVVLTAEIGVNFFYYRKIVLPAWNIVQYNVLSSETDSTLYGVEPWSFYALNLALNFNIAAAMALPSLLVVFLLPRSASAGAGRRLAFLSPLFIWLAIMFAQAHKEERFLFPVYPLLCLGAAITLSSAVASVWGVFGPGSSFGNFTVTVLVYGSLGLYSLLSISRVTSNVVNYSAPIRIYSHLHDHVLPSPTKNVFMASGSATAVTTLCIGKEWYRFPSSFFVPTNATSVRFLKSSFSGQLPKPFEQHENGTSVIPTDMNNQNREEFTRYTPEDDCDYVVDLNLPGQQETKFWESPGKWQLIHSEPFLNADASRSPYRALYVPFLTTKHVQYVKYAVYKQKRDTTPHTP
ncbi:hypothetical protein Poli38472_011352 [Pythium oligandrum]|uniref:Mannosyltransferase n=1 Tax=Pythium oligandrum TaxID=41045 RepID=A0A8K1FM41_PYTOL|nr:hypothetical protein Poli38472_011352 [Pythium oligandrum]|eukprot:TMW64472.1 hypothetical protein Poli38472_011352 [Pythium oligandrum]